MTRKGKIISVILSLFVTMPIWYFLLYTILSYIQPDRLVWFLFWAYIPTQILSVMLIELSKDD